MKKTFRLSALVLTLLFAFTLVACAPKDASAAKKKMEKKDYTVTIITESKDAEGGAVARISGHKGGLVNSTDHFVAIQYDTKETAKNSIETVKKFYETMFGKSDDLENNAQQVGKWVIVGTSQAIKDFK